MARRRVSRGNDPLREGLTGLRLVAEECDSGRSTPVSGVPAPQRSPTTPVVDRTEDGLGVLRRGMHRAPTPSSQGKLRFRGMEALPHAPPDTFAQEDMELRAHGIRESLLHSQSGFSDFRGFMNLAMLFLFVSSFRIAAENLGDYGVLADIYPFVRAFHPMPLTVNRLTFLSLMLYVAAACVIERAAAALATSEFSASGKDQFRRAAAEMLLDGLHVANIMSALIIPCIIVTVYETPLFGGFLVVFQAVITWMKLISYVAVNQHYRSKLRQVSDAPKGGGSAKDEVSDSASDAGDPPQLTRRRPRERTVSESSDASGPKVLYPDNLTFGDIFFFLAIPTLCYELKFPRTPRIRLRFVFRRAVEVLSLLITIIFLVQQWMTPLVAVTLELGDDVSLVVLFGRILKMALPNNLIWLILFYMYFHSFTNLCAELLRFGDRQFYRDWWNAHTVSYFWRNWNIPVHKWMLRHVYRPLRAMGCSRTAAVTAVFALSALLHEVVISTPIGVFKGISFAGMLVYVPLATVTDYIFKQTGSKTWGNVVVWGSLVLGQPAGIILYAKGFQRLSGQAVPVPLGNRTL